MKKTRIEADSDKWIKHWRNIYGVKVTIAKPIYRYSWKECRPIPINGPAYRQVFDLDMHDDYERIATKKLGFIGEKIMRGAKLTFSDADLLKVKES